MKLFLSAGEASGDVYGGALLREMRRLGLKADIPIEALGSTHIRESGAHIIADSAKWGAIGIAQALKVALRVVKGLRAAKRAIGPGCGLLIAIDFGYVNVKLARHAKRMGWKVLYFMPPGSWRRDRHGSDLPLVTDAISTPFPWSEAMLKKAGANVHWYGHPIRQLIKEKVLATFHRETLAVLPGSRKHEIELNLPLISEAIKGRPEKFEFAVASSLHKDWLMEFWRNCSGRMDDIFTESDTYGVLSRSKAAVVCSGTATLEAALCSCPMVVVYKISGGMLLEAKLMGLRNQFISLPNILLQRPVVPELANSDINPADLAILVKGLLSNGPEYEKQLQAFKELETLLGPEDAITKTAELALSLI